MEKFNLSLPQILANLAEVTNLFSYQVMLHSIMGISSYSIDEQIIEHRKKQQGNLNLSR